MVGEDCPGRDRKGMATVVALPLPPIPAEGMPADRAAARAGHFLTLAPAQFPEQGERFRVGHLHDLQHGQRAGFCGEEEVLLVGSHLPRALFCICVEIITPMQNTSTHICRYFFNSAEYSLF